MAAPIPAPDQHVEIARLQRDISRKLDLPMDKLVFNFRENSPGITLELITINPRHDQAFLFHTVEATGKTEALEMMLDYVVKSFRKEQSYTVQWAQRGSGELHTSYFRAQDMYEVLDKFYHGRQADTYIVFSVVLNPIA
ncbi:MAG: hypothetical protein SF053_08365 [Bacteroidia bacterium]|nr:hypothetical protein [Bacteroidia bacterium]